MSFSKYVQEIGDPFGSRLVNDQNLVVVNELVAQRRQIQQNKEGKKQPWQPPFQSQRVIVAVVNIVQLRCHPRISFSRYRFLTLDTHSFIAIFILTACRTIGYPAQELFPTEG